MFRKRINTRTARLYRHFIIIGINKARGEFRHTPRLPSTPPLWNMGEAGISEAGTSIEVESRAYQSEKRKHGWVSQPKETKDTQNGMPTALMVAAISAGF